MIARTLFFSIPGHLGVNLAQLVYTPARETGHEPRTFPIEDLGFIVIETHQMTVTAYALQALAENNTAVIFCDKTHTPASQLLPFSGHTLTQKHFAAQMTASEALKGRLWKQTVQAKICNQAACLDAGRKEGSQRLRRHVHNVKNGDPGNCEGLAAREYWNDHTPDTDFKRTREGPMPNAALNYGYAILRAATARALAGSGLSCLSGLHHHNQYNAFTLADDVMEPYRPFVDDIVLNNLERFPAEALELTRDMKASLLNVLTADVMVSDMRRPLMNALSLTTASLVRCFLKEETIIAYPSFPTCPSPTTP
jgi:CRISPR-associated protein Cas1